MDDTQNDQFSDKTNDNQHFELEITISPANFNSNLVTKSTPNNASYMAGSFLPPPPTSLISSRSISQARNANDESDQLQIPSQPNLPILKKSNNSDQINTELLNMFNSAVNNNIIKQKPPAQNYSPQLKTNNIPPQTQNNPISNSNQSCIKSNITIEGYRMSQNNTIEYQISSPNQKTVFCPSTQVGDFEAIRQFWLKNNSFDKSKPSKPIQKIKAKLKEKIQSDVSDSSNKVSPKIHSNFRINSKIKSNFSEDFYEDKLKVNILGITQRYPIIKIAFTENNDSKVTVVTAAEAKKLFPMQLSIFYEKFVTFYDYE